MLFIDEFRERCCQYLWIDPIYIIQDSPEDKSHEISEMADIYKGAYVTVCAARVETATEGFLQDQGDKITNFWKDLFPPSYSIPNMEATSATEAFQKPKYAIGTLWLMEERSKSVSDSS